MALTVEQKIKQEIRSALANAGVDDITDELIVVPPKPDHGDYAFACFEIAQKVGRNPAEYAQSLAGSVKPGEYIERAVGAGAFVNFFCSRIAVVQAVCAEVAAPEPAFRPLEGKRVMIEWPSPNSNKPLHLGHLRNVFIGETIARLYEYHGARVMRVSLLNDRGIHIMKVLVAYRAGHLGETPKSVGMKGDAYVGKLYVEYSQGLDIHPQWEQEAQELLRRYEAGDKQVISLWKKINTWAMSGIKETLRRCGIAQEKWYLESNIFQDGKDLVAQALGAQVLERDHEGNVVARLEQYGLPDKVVLRSDGTAVYATQDIALAAEKLKQADLDESLIVVGQEQELYMQQLFEILRLMNIGKSSLRYSAVHYGLVNLPEGRMKSREGTVVDADDLIDEVREAIRQEIMARDTALNEKTALKRAEIMAISAIRYLLIATTTKKPIVFNPRESVAINGKTAAYIQYAYARMSSVIAKAPRKLPEIDWGVMAHDEGYSLMRDIVRIPGVLWKSHREQDPSFVASCAYELAHAFNDYYERNRIVTEDMMQTAVRVGVCRTVQQGLGILMRILGVEPLKRV